MARTHFARNMGAVDRAVRGLVIGPVALGAALGLGPTSIGGAPVLVIAGIALVTGATGVCPAYVPFGIDTRRGKPAPHRP